MNNQEQLNKKLKTYKIIRIICIITFIITILLTGITAPTSTALATIFAFLCIIAIITGLILDKKIKKLKIEIYQIKTISKAINDSKEEN